ncbi:YhbY family RNA-binding protein [Fervidicoccus fontis]|uniref:YhbY family RNA-binding protein n=1 Tax=Fervidicoccus fontis TaxID=683846 RepID=A0A843A9Y0_9CREN|nr:YhbY family RNA-binding protein [Fervidicoccus fontis]MBE9390632.1 YhbY family RNA-binding protein [Fervidicoccus fontis]
MNKRKKYVRLAYNEMERVFYKATFLFFEYRSVDFLRYGGRYIKSIAQKTNLPVRDDLKHFICKRCGAILIPGVNSSYRIHSKSGNSYLKVKCLNCGYSKKIIFKPRDVVKSKMVRADINIGKNGINERIIKEIDTRLKVKKVVKIRINKNFIESSGEEREEIAKKVSSFLNAELVEIRGNTFILKRNL